MLDDLRLLPYFINEELFIIPADRTSKNPEGPQANEGAGSESKKPVEHLGITVKPPADKKETIAKAPPVAVAQNDSGKPQSRNPNLIFGKNGKKLLILVEDHNNPVMERADGLLLKDILKAIGYTFDDVAIVNISHCREDADWEVINSIPFQTLFSFGINHPKIPVTATLAPYELEMSGESRFLLTDKLAVLRQDRSLKVALWNLLKRFFV